MNKENEYHITRKMPEVHMSWLLNELDVVIKSLI